MRGEGQTDNFRVAGENVDVVFSGRPGTRYEVRYLVVSRDECTGQQSKDLDGTELKKTISDTQIASKEASRGFTWRRNPERWVDENRWAAVAGDEHEYIKKQVSGGGLTGNEDEYIKKQIAGGGMCNLDESRNRAMTDDLQPTLKLLESHLRTIVEDGDVNSEFMKSRSGELVDSERGHGRGTGIDDGGRRWEATTVGRGGESKRINVRQGKKNQTNVERRTGGMGGKQKWQHVCSLRWEDRDGGNGR